LHEVKIMDEDREICGKMPNKAPREVIGSPLPANCVEIIELRSASIEHRLGYFRAEPLVIFAYCPAGGEVIWKDGHSSGFGTGGWRIFLEEIAPLAQRRGVRLGGLMSAGTHVLLMDRRHGTVYAAPRHVAEEFLVKAYGIPPPKRPCLCMRLDCAACSVRSCAKSGSVENARDSH
jgi:hypothetical protein